MIGTVNETANYCTGVFFGAGDAGTGERYSPALGGVSSEKRDARLDDHHF